MQVMQEVMAKSKAFKAAKQQQREEDLSATDALDADFKQLLEAGDLGLQFKAPGSRQDRPAPGSLDPQDMAYDRMRRELVFEAKAQVCLPADQLHLGILFLEHEASADSLHFCYMHLRPCSSACVILLMPEHA